MSSYGIFGLFVHVRLTDLGYQVGNKMLDLIFLREKQQYKREVKLINMLTFIKTSVWKVRRITCLYVTPFY